MWSSSQLRKRNAKPNRGLDVNIHVWARIKWKRFLIYQKLLDINLKIGPLMAGR